MFKSLRLINFKSFRDETLELGPFTTIVGANASGKSNILDAFRFLNGVGRGYSLTDIFSRNSSEAWGWEGVRGGYVETPFHGSTSFAMEAEFSIFIKTQGQWKERKATYFIEVEFSGNGKPPQLAQERLSLKDGSDGQVVFQTRRPSEKETLGPDKIHVCFTEPLEGRDSQERIFLKHAPALTQIIERLEELKETREAVIASRDALQSMRFFNFAPGVMRHDSPPGRDRLGDRGENLSSVLQSICKDERRKKTLLDWLQALTPMDAVNLEFATDLSGNIVLYLLEKDGRKTSIFSSSEGTLRFLGVLAAFFSPRPDCFYAIEEVENGIHPARLRLLLQLIERQVKSGSVFLGCSDVFLNGYLIGEAAEMAISPQVIATTHSPLVLGGLQKENLEHALLVYRRKKDDSSRIVRLLDVPEARRLIEAQDFYDLYASGWFEDALELENGSER